MTDQDQQLKNTIYLSTLNLLSAGTHVLGERFGFTDEQQAEWIEATAELGRERMNAMSERLESANKKLVEFSDRENDRT